MTRSLVSKDLIITVLCNFEREMWNELTVINPQRACERVTVVDCLSVCVSLTDFGDPVVITLKTSINAKQMKSTGVLTLSEHITAPTFAIMMLWL